VSAVAAGWNRDEDDGLGVSISRDTNRRVGRGEEGAQSLQRMNEGERVKLELGKPD